jgi:hypothetical protein
VDPKLPYDVEQSVIGISQYDDHALVSMHTIHTRMRKAKNRIEGANEEEEEEGDVRTILR